MKRLCIIYLTALAALLSCTREKNDVLEEHAIRHIPYRAEVTSAGTKASINGSTLYIFEPGDRLYVSHTSGSEVKMHGFLTMVSGAGSTKAVFQGDLVCDDEFSPESDTSVDIVLVGANDLMHEATTGGLLSPTAAYPDDVYASSFAEAVQHYSNFTCSGQFGDGSFILSQQSSFLLFSIKIKKTLAPVGTTFIASIYNNSGTDLLRSATVSPVDNTSTTTKVEFVAVFPGGSTSLSNATISLVEEGSGNALHEWSIGDASLARNNYYNVNRAYKAYDGFRIIAKETGIIYSNNTGGRDVGLQYSCDYGETWLAYPSEGIPVSKDEEICFRSDANTWNEKTIYSTEEFAVLGDVASLLEGSDFGTSSASIPKNYSFCGLFRNSKLVDASELVLSMDTMYGSSLKSLFEGCSNLVYGPKELPPAKLASTCYRNMFWNCTKLVSAPIIQKPISHDGRGGWYQQMFRNCSSLQEIVFLDDFAYDSGNFTNWVSGINPSGTFYKSSTMISFPAAGNSSTPSGWTVSDYVEPAP